VPDRVLRVLVVDHAADAAVVSKMLATADRPGFAVRTAGDLVSALDELARQSFDIAIVEVSLPDSQGLATFETIMRHAPGLPVVIHTGITNEALALTAVERGAQDYLIKGKITQQALVRVLQYSLVRYQGMRHSKPSDAARAKAIGILAVKGGVGATTFAAFLGVELKKQTGARVLLVDLDAGAKSAAFLMKTDSPYTMMDAAANLNRLDGAFWSGVVTRSSYGMDLLQSPGSSGFVEPPPSERLRHVLRFARTLYDFIVVDLGRLGPLSLGLIEDMTEICVVSTSGLPEMYEATRVLKRLGELGLTSSNRLKLVFNRVPKGSPLTAEDIANAMGTPVFATLTDCAGELEDAFAAGRFLDERLPLRKQVAQLAARILGVEERASSGGMLGLVRLARSWMGVAGPTSAG